MSLEDQCLLEVMYGNTATRDLLKEEIDEDWFNDIQNKIFMYDNQLDNDLIANTISNIVLSTDTIQIQEGIVKLSSKLKGYSGIDAMEKAAEIWVACQGDLYDIIYINQVPYIEPHYTVSKETKEILEQKQYLLPMVHPPLKWSNNFDGGWLLHRKCAIHGKINHHGLPQALDSLNILQNIEWELDLDMLNYEEEPNKPTDTMAKREQFLRLKQSSRAAYEEIVEMGNSFYFVWRFDKRGRMYSQGYQINLQSTGYKKSLLNFSNKQVITGNL